MSEVLMYRPTEAVVNHSQSDDGLPFVGMSWRKGKYAHLVVEWDHATATYMSACHTRLNGYGVAKIDSPWAIRATQSLPCPKCAKDPMFVAVLEQQTASENNFITKEVGLIIEGQVFSYIASAETWNKLFNAVSIPFRTTGRARNTLNRFFKFVFRAQTPVLSARGHIIGAIRRYELYKKTGKLDYWS